jgi:alkaline phosphatase D
MKIGFGSCLKQDKSMPIFDPIKTEKLDLFLMIGDNVYGDSEEENLEELELAYKQQKKNFKMMNLDFPFEAIWDDHDYGLNDAGIEYPFKKKSKELFLDFWNVPPDDVRRFREGLYFDLIYEINNKTLQILFLDTRTFRDNLKPSDNIGGQGKERYIPNTDSSLTILGINQWSWFKEKLNHKVDFRVIVSSIQFLPIGHGWESWNNFPHERKKLIEMIDETNLDQTLVISGDRHRAGIYKVKTNSGKIIFDVTSSSLNASFPMEEEYGPLRIGNTFIEENYGVIIVDGKNDIMFVNIKDLNGETVRNVTVIN